MRIRGTRRRGTLSDIDAQALEEVRGGTCYAERLAYHARLQRLVPGKYAATPAVRALADCANVGGLPGGNNARAFGVIELGPWGPRPN